MNQKTTTRDYSLDFFRACLLAYIVCIIHSLYWLRNGAEPYKSLLLFEMPLIFFVAGAAANLAGYRGKTFKSILSSRAKRVLLPYLIYVVISLVIGFGILYFKGDGPIVFPIRHTVSSIISGKSIPNVPYTWHLWFIPVYFLISISTPLQVWAIEKLKGRKLLYLAICALLWGVSAILVHLTQSLHIYIYIVSQVLIYNLFYISGYFFYKRLSVRTLIGLAVIAIALLCIMTGGQISPMQAHKFSQDHIFLIYGFAAILIFSILFTYIRIGNSPSKFFRLGLDRWNKYGFTIYLWQNWSFFLLVTIAEILDIPVRNCPKSLVYVVPALYIISWGLSWIAVPVEQYIMRVFRCNR